MIYGFLRFVLYPPPPKKTRKSVVRIKAKEFEDVDSEFRLLQ